ncbi:hypothetical protein VRK_32970 [Vibrio sp. MEBiC08052]|nr:hypothetical protein VRK_32970 [Vibrio sp. MEBiC08052]
MIVPSDQSHLLSIILTIRRQQAVCFMIVALKQTMKSQRKIRNMKNL